MKIVKIKENSLGKEIGHSAGNQLIKINGELSQIIVEKDYNDDLGVEQISEKLNTTFNISKNDSIKEIIDYIQYET